MTTTSTGIEQSFIKHFEADVHNAYQQQGSKLQSTVRSKNNIKGASTTFQVIGKATAATKTRNAQISTSAVTHEPVECSLTDYYSGQWVDSLDELKVGHDERKALATAGAYALGRKTDELIINALKGATQTVGSGVLTKARILEAFTMLNNNDVPDDGERYALLSPEAWNQLMGIEEFSNANYVGEAYPYLTGSETRKWMGIVWIMHTGLPADTTNKTHDCFIYHKSAVGHASGQDIKTDITWHGDYAAHFVNNMMSQGACLIDKKGVVKLTVADSASQS